MDIKNHFAMLLQKRRDLTILQWLVGVVVALLSLYIVITIFATGAYYNSSKIPTIMRVFILDSNLKVVISFLCFVIEAGGFIYLKFQKVIVETESNTLTSVSQTIEIEVHALLPLTGDAKGDGLLQAAGLMAGDEVYTNVKVIFYDHKNDIRIARKLVKKLMDQWKAGDPPLWILATMSDVCIELSKMVSNELVNRPELAESFTLLMTVAAASSVPHEPNKGIIRYSIDGADEVQKIAEYLQSSRRAHKLDPVILLPVSSVYPQQALALLASDLMKAGIPYLALPLPENGKLALKATCDGIFADSCARKAIVFGYDLAMFEAFEFLIDQGFRGKIICPTTLSVPDWQQYLTNSTKLKPSHIKYAVLEYCFDKASDGAGFENALKRWTFSALTTTENVYGEAIGEEIQKTFNKLERKVYKTIEPNYISALCFDSIRLLNAVAMAGERQFTTLDKISQLTNNDCGPFSGVVQDDRGFLKPKVKLNVVQL